MEARGGDRLGLLEPREGVGDAFAARTVAICKRIVEEAPQSQRIAAEADASEVFRTRNAIEPPLPFESLILIKETSNALPQAIEAMAQNVDGFGFRLRPTLDLTAADAWERVRALVVRERKKWLESVDRVLGNEGAPPFAESFEPGALEPDDDTLERILGRLRAEAEEEREGLDAFFCSCATDQAFVDLRKDTRRDLELMGNAAWEVLRDARGRLAGFERLPMFSVRLTPLDDERTEFEERVRLGPFDARTRRRRKRFRRYVQMAEGSGGGVVFFKEFRDPRPISRLTGQVLGPDHDPRERANEALHFRLFAHDRSVYGIPRWIGSLLAALGSRQSEEVNYLHFDNKGIPLGILAVEGGALSEETVKRIADHIEQHIKGKRNYHRILPMEATLSEGAPAHSGAPRVRWIDLSGAIQKDALFTDYDEKNREKVRSAFRLPPFFLGQVKDFNRATALAVKQVAEEQVFAPERQSFDDLMNRLVLPELGARWWSFESRGVPLTDPLTVKEIITDLVDAGVVLPGEVRSKVAEALGLPLSPLHDLLGALPPKALPPLLAALSPDEVLRALDVELPPKEAPVTGQEGDFPGRLVPAQELPPELLGPTSFSSLTEPERDERLYALAAEVKGLQERLAALMEGASAHA